MCVICIEMIQVMQGNCDWMPLSFFFVFFLISVAVISHTKPLMRPNQYPSAKENRQVRKAKTHNMIYRTIKNRIWCMSFEGLPYVAVCSCCRAQILSCDWLVGPVKHVFAQTEVQSYKDKRHSWTDLYGTVNEKCAVEGFVLPTRASAQ